MGIKNLSEFIKYLVKKNDILKVKQEIDPILEISEIIDKISKKKDIVLNNGDKYKNPAIYFENLKGSQYPLAINLFGSIERIEYGFGSSLDNLVKEIEELVKLQPPKGFLDAIKLFPKFGKIFQYRPRYIKNGACQKYILKGEDINLYELPIMKCWPEDGGNFITLNQVITKNIETNRLNFGMYRLQVLNRNTTGMHWHKHHDGASTYYQAKRFGRHMEIAVSLGGPPALIYGATAPLPPFIDELIFSSFLMKSSIDMVKCKTVDLFVPAESEIVLEGYVDPQEELIYEGPFGDHTGYYSKADYFPAFHITAITMRENPIYPSILVGRPPMEDTYLGKVTERLFLPLLKLFIPEVVDMSFPEFGVFHNFVFVSIKKRYPFQAKKVMNAIWGLGQMMLTKFIVIVEDDINVQDTQEVLWVLSNNVDPKRDILIIEGPLDQLDHSSPFSLGGSKMGFDATTRWKEEGYSIREYPKIMKMLPEVKNKVENIWHNLFEKF